MLLPVKGAVGCERKARPIRDGALAAVSALAFAEALAQAGVEWAFFVLPFSFVSFGQAKEKKVGNKHARITLQTLKKNIIRCLAKRFNSSPNLGEWC